MIRRHHLIVLTLPVLAAGCAERSAPTPAASAETIAEAPQVIPAALQNPKPITRREVVPQGVTTESGLTVPKGFRVNVFAENLDGPRRMAIAPGGTAKGFDVFVSESKAGRVRVLRDSNGDGTADAMPIFAEGLNQPYGLAFHPDGWLYVGETGQVVRVPWQPNKARYAGQPQRITKLTEGGYNQHWTRNVLFSRDFKKLYVSVGSSCNTCEEDDPQRAAISVMNPDGSDRKLFASGLRNPVGMAWQPNTNNLWSVINERDRLGDDIPPDYLTLVRAGGFYGWPYAYTDINRRIFPDPNFGSNRAMVKKTLAPTVPVQAHSAALGLAFYAPQTGGHNFPAAYNGDAFLAFHGSWNRSAKTGYKIVRVDFQNGAPATVSDFARGFQKGGDVWGRPVDVQMAPDGSLLFSDDGGGKIWRVSFAG